MVRIKYDRQKCIHFSLRTSSPNSTPISSSFLFFCLATCPRYDLTPAERHQGESTKPCGVQMEPLLRRYNGGSALNYRFIMDSQPSIPLSLSLFIPNRRNCCCCMFLSWFLRPADLFGKATVLTHVESFSFFLSSE